jgi:hypothetical protein
VIIIDFLMQTEEERRVEGAKELEKNELFRRKFKIYGKRNWLTIPEDRKDELRSKFDQINTILKKTTDHFSNKKNFA